MSLLLALLPSAWPCAGLVTPDYREQLASSDAQQAILQIGASQVSAEYRVRYAGNATDFAWIIPVPGKVEAVEEGDERRFTGVEGATAPTAVYWSEDEAEGDAKGGCGGAKAGGTDNLADTAQGGRGLGDGTSSGISIVASGYAGAFEYTVLEAESADGLVAWLEAEGYDPTISAPSIQAYVDDTIAFSWVAVQLSPEAAETPDGGVALPPLRLTWSAGEDGILYSSYPARMAATSMLAEVRTELYVMGGSRVEPQNGWTVAERSYDEWDYTMTAGAGSEPSEAYAETLREVGTTHPVLYPVWGGEYVDSVAGQTWLTRYDTILAPPTNQKDMVFTETGDIAPFETTIGKREEEGASPAWLLPLGLGGLLLRRRRG
jgi:MYXO-CTERM domain-containing protein